MDNFPFCVICWRRVEDIDTHMESVHGEVNLELQAPVIDPEIQVPEGNHEIQAPEFDPEMQNIFNEINWIFEQDGANVEYVNFQVPRNLEEDLNIIIDDLLNENPSTDDEESEEEGGFNQHGGGDPFENIQFRVVRSLEHFMIYSADVEPLFIQDVWQLIDILRDQILEIFTSIFQEYTTIRVQMVIQVQCSKETEGEIEIDDETYFSSTNDLITNQVYIEQFLQDSAAKLDENLRNFTAKTSNWVIDLILQLSFNISKYTRRPGTKYIPLPPTYHRCHSLLNIKNTDKFCIKYCLLAAKFPEPNRFINKLPKTYLKFWDKINDDGVEYPVNFGDILKLERQNNMAINVFILDRGIPAMCLCSRNMKLGTRVVNLLLLENKTTSHYVLIRNLNNFLEIKNKQPLSILCYKCGTAFSNEYSRNLHFMECSQYGIQIARMPKPGTRLKFDSIHLMMRRKFICVLDLEVLSSDTRIPAAKYTNYKKIHTPVSYSYVIAEIYTKKIRVVREGLGEGQALMKELMFNLNCDINLLSPELELLSKHGWNRERMEIYRDRHPVCEIPSCLRYIPEISQRFVHHDHVSGKVYGVVCPSCNRKAYKCKKLAVFIHNLNYDVKFLVQGLSRDDKVFSINKSKEKYIFLQVGKLQFVDSMGFLANASLEKVTQQLKSSGREHFALVKDIFALKQENGLGDVSLLEEKGSFPYEEFSNLNSLISATEMSPKSSFYSSLNDSHISDEVYNNSLAVWTSFKCTNMAQYLQIYNLTDSALLLCALLFLHEQLYKEFELDLTNFVSLPGFAYQAMLKVSNADIELLTEGEYHILTKFEGMIRGGLSTVGDRKIGIANHELIDGYKRLEPDLKKTFTPKEVDNICLSKIINLIDEEVEKLGSLGITEYGPNPEGADHGHGIYPNPITLWKKIKSTESDDLISLDGSLSPFHNEYENEDGYESSFVDDDEIVGALSSESEPENIREELKELDKPTKKRKRVISINESSDELSDFSNETNCMKRKNARKIENNKDFNFVRNIPTPSIDPPVVLVAMDASNLYGQGLSMPLPVGGFRLIDDQQELDDMDFNTINPNGIIGYIINADFTYPKNIRQKTNLFPLLPEHYEVRPSDLSNDQKKAFKGSTQKKLTATFRKRKKYTISLHNFQLNCKLGIKPTKIHWAVEFYQTTVFKCWIERCTRLRNSTNMEFLIAIAKLLANASFGRIAMSVRKRKRIELITNEKDARRICRSLFFESFEILTPDVTQTECRKASVEFNSPIQMGAVVLEHAKYIMYRFMYEILVPYFGDKLHLILHDTDSFYISIEGIDYKDWIEFVKKHEDEFDLSNFDKDHELFSLKHQRRPGKMKIEYTNKVIKAIIAQRSKEWSMIFTDGSSEKKMKGIKKNIVKKKIAFVHYLIALLSKRNFKTRQMNFLSQRHKLYTTESFKSALNTVDMKRKALSLFRTQGIGYSDSDSDHSEHE